MPTAGRTFVSALGLVLCAAQGTAAEGKLTVGDGRAAGGGSVVVMDVSDGVVDVQKGSGTDPAAIAMVVDLECGGVRSRIEAPAGAFDGVAGWLENDITRARYRDTQATAGAAGVSRATITGDRRLRFKARGLDAVFLDALAAESACAVHLAVTIVNGAESVRRCVGFGAAGCRQKRNARRSSLKCRQASEDVSCAAVPAAPTTTVSTTLPTTTVTTTVPAVCGNAVREPGEQCDGSEGCMASCTLISLAASSCCQGADVCETTPAFSLNFYVSQWCAAYPQYVLGGTCDEPAGTCVVGAFLEPIPLCCETQVGCYDSTAAAADSAALWWFRNSCTGAQDGAVYEGACDAGQGLCVRD